MQMNNGREGDPEVAEYELPPTLTKTESMPRQPGFVSRLPLPTAGIVAVTALFTVLARYITGAYFVTPTIANSGNPDYYAERPAYKAAIENLQPAYDTKYSVAVGVLVVLAVIIWFCGRKSSHIAGNIRPAWRTWIGSFFFLIAIPLGLCAIDASDTRWTLVIFE